MLDKPTHVDIATTIAEIARKIPGSTVEGLCLGQAEITNDMFTQMPDRVASSSASGS